MCRRIGVVGANGVLHLTERGICHARIGGNQRDGTNTLVIQAEILGVRAGDDQFLMRGGKNTQAFCIFLQTTGKTLVSEVKQRQPAVGL